MSTTTTNYGLIKPDTTDPILIGQLNDNADAIDAALKENADAIENKPDAADIPTPSNAAPAMDGTGSAGTSDQYARADHVHPSDTSKQNALTTTQLAAVNSGIDSAKVAQIATNENNILNIQTTVASYHKASGTDIYFSETGPTGTITVGSYWISTDGIKIYGDTDNLFDGTVVQGSFDPATGGDVESTNRVRTTFMTSPLTRGTYVLSVVGADDTIMYVYNESKQFMSELSVKSWQTLPCTFILSGTYYIRFGLRKNDNADIVPSEVTSITIIKKNTWH